MLYIDDLVQKLIEIKNKEGNLEVCVVGHYGEINEIGISDIYITDARNDVFGNSKRKIVNILG